MCKLDVVINLKKKGLFYRHINWLCRQLICGNHNFLNTFNWGLDYPIPVAGLK